MYRDTRWKWNFFEHRCAWKCQSIYRVAQLKRKSATNFFVTQKYTPMRVENMSTKRSEWLRQWMKRICWWKRVLLHWKNTMRYSMEEQVFMLTEYITTHLFVHIREASKNKFPDSGEPPDSTILRVFRNFLIPVVSSITQEHTFVPLEWPLIITASAIVLIMLLAYQRRRTQSLNLSLMTVQCFLKEIKCTCTIYCCFRNWNHQTIHAE